MGASAFFTVGAPGRRKSQRRLRPPGFQSSWSQVQPSASLPSGVPRTFGSAAAGHKHQHHGRRKEVSLLSQVREGRIRRSGFQPDNSLVRLESLTTCRCGLLQSHPPGARCEPPWSNPFSGCLSPVDKSPRRRVPRYTVNFYDVDTCRNALRGVPRSPSPRTARRPFLQG
jgi:hypothetical protein